MVALHANQLLCDFRNLVTGNGCDLRSPYSPTNLFVWVRTSLSRYPTTVRNSSLSPQKLVTLKADNFIINGKKYTADTLDQLTGELSMETFSERSNDKVLVMGGIYSNFHPLSNLVFRKQKYANIEQHVKAVLFNDQDSAVEI